MGDGLRDALDPRTSLDWLRKALRNRGFSPAATL